MVFRGTLLGVTALGMALLSACSSGPLEPSNAYQYVDEQQARRDLAIPPELIALENTPLLLVPGLPPEALAPSSTPTAAAGADTTLSAQNQATVTDAAEGIDPTHAPSNQTSKQPSTGQHSILVAGNKQTVWAQLLAFWQAEAVALEAHNSQQGILRTEWRDDPSRIANDFISRALQSLVGGLYASDYRDQYLLQVEPAPNPGHSTLHLVHYGTEQKTTYDIDGDIDNTAWVPRPYDPQHATAMLHKIATFLAQQTPAATDRTTSTPTPKIDQRPQVADTAAAPVSWIHSLYPEPHRQIAEDNLAPSQQLQQTTSTGALYVANALPMAWSLLDKALQHPSFGIQHQNQAEGLYLVEYPLPTDGMGQRFLSKLAFWGPSAEPAVTQQYQLVLRSHAGGSIIHLLDTQGRAIRTPQGAQLFNQIAGYFQPAL